MTASPKHAWPLVKLGAVLSPVERAEKVNPAASYRLLGVRLDGNGAFLRETVTGAQTSAPTLYRVETDDFIFSRLFACRGAFGIIGPDLDGCHVSGEFPTFRPKLSVEGTPKIDVRYLRYWFRLPGVVATVNEQCTGSTPLTRNRFKEDKFLALEIPLPPLAEQRRLVARLDSLAGRIAEARKLREEADDEAAAFQSRIAQDLFPDSMGTTVGNWVRFQTGYAFKSEWFSDIGVRLARNVNIGHKSLDWAESVRLPDSYRKDFHRFELQEGDILISLDRPIISTGVKVAQVRACDLPCLLLQRVARAQFEHTQINPEYFFHWLNSPRFISAINPGRSNGVPHISHKDIEKIPFAAPPLAEQRRIVAELDALQTKVDALKRHQADSAAELDALLPALLDRAFKGEL